jgi:Cu(I)/Ag(I) efflux system membrane fusion protein
VTARRGVPLILSVLALVAAAFAGGLLLGHKARPSQEAAGGRRILYYRDPMNPQLTSSTPKKDPMGMDYVPEYEGEAGAAGPPPGAGPNAVRIDPRITQNIGVTSEKAMVRDLVHTIRTVGMVNPDERRLYSITVKFAGWVERLYINFTGDTVRQGAPLAAIYSPELLATQREYLVALRYARSVEGAGQETRTDAESLVASARRRLELWDIPEHQIDELARRGEATRLMTIHAPADGVVLERNVTAGSQVQPGMVLLRIADLREVWVFAQIYPYQLPWIQRAQPARIQVPGMPGRAIEGRVNYIQPVVSAEARTVEVRIQVVQPGEGILLKPNMYANVEICSPLGRRGIVLSDQSIIRTGERNVAIVALGNGTFEPRDVTLGATSDGHIEILEGLQPGEEVVTSAEFLIDSESNLRAALNAMRAPATDAGQPGHPMGAPMGGSGAGQEGHPGGMGEPGGQNR